MTLPNGGGMPLVSCQRMRRTDGKRLSAGRAPVSNGVEARGIASNLRPLPKKSSGHPAPRENVYQYCDAEPQPMGDAPSGVHTRLRRLGRRAERRDSAQSSATISGDEVAYRAEAQPRVWQVEVERRLASPKGGRTTWAVCR
jgi:hypothetical protein